jgi:hypothetical protein
MPALRNPHPFDIFVHTLGRHIRRRQTVELTQEELDAIPDNGVFEKIFEPPRKRTPVNARSGGKVSEISGKRGERRSRTD